MKKILKNKFRVFKLDFIEPIELFRKFETYSNLVFLDSAGPLGEDSRYSYLAVDPLYRIKVQDKKTYINGKEKKICLRNTLQSLLNICSHNKIKGIPHFQCGLSGYVSYDYCLNIENIPQIDKKKNNFPDLNIGLYDLVFAFDLKLKKTFLFSLDLDDTKYSQNLEPHITRRKRLLNFYKLPYITHSIQNNNKLKWKQETSKKEYKTKIKKIISYINNGDIFQTNYTHRFTAKKPDDLSDNLFYLSYRNKTKTPFSAFLNFGDVSVCSFSPERFIKVDNLKVTTSPIKGTVKTSFNKIRDNVLKENLIKSEKNLAENLMIVDVLRNDISKICIKGSVKVKALAELRTYKNVHHLVSTIGGKLESQKDILNLLISCLPGGSVTGAPKIRAMEIISELEKSKRGVYCGAIGYISFSGDADFNIPIRTASIFNNQISINCGGGIVADSKAESEFRESIDKISNIIKDRKRQSKENNKRIVIK